MNKSRLSYSGALLKDMDETYKREFYVKISELISQPFAKNKLGFVLVFRRNI
jgi:hypothetical protein